MTMVCEVMSYIYGIFSCLYCAAVESQTFLIPTDAHYYKQSQNVKTI